MVAAHALLSLDLWLHIWTPAVLFEEGAQPTESVALARECARPAAAYGVEDTCEVRVSFRTEPPPGMVTRLGGFLRWRPAAVPRKLWLRCVDEAAASELLKVIDLVEKMYPDAL